MMQTKHHWVSWLVVYSKIVIKHITSEGKILILVFSSSPLLQSARSHNHTYKKVSQVFVIPPSNIDRFFKIL